MFLKVWLKMRQNIKGILIFTYIYLSKNDFYFILFSRMRFLYNYYRIFNNNPIVKSAEDDIVVIETSLKRL